MAADPTRWPVTAIVGGLLFGFFLCVAVLSWTGLAGQDWAAAGGGSWERASAQHWFGTNVLGQDIFARTVYSVGVAFEVGLLVALASTALGALAGAVSGWLAGSWVDELVLFLAGVIDSIPFYLFVAALAFALRDNPASMVIALVATLWTGTARLVRAEVMRLAPRDFVQAALALGLPGPRVLARHVLPNTAPVLLAQLAIAFVAAIKSEVILSFLGLGLRDGVSWGLMLAEATQEVLTGRFNNLLAASIPLFLLLLGFNLLVDTTQDRLDPRQGVA